MNWFLKQHIQQAILFSFLRTSTVPMSFEQSRTFDWLFHPSPVFTRICYMLDSFKRTNKTSWLTLKDTHPSNNTNNMVDHHVPDLCVIYNSSRIFDQRLGINTSGNRTSGIDFCLDLMHRVVRGR